MTLTSSAAYGFTEGQAVAPGSHHRLRWRVGAALTPVAGLDLGLGTGVRHDRHSAPDALGDDQGTVLSSDLYARVGRRVGSALRLGLGASAGFPGGVSVARSLASPALDAQLLAAYVPVGSAWSIGALAGFRYDRSTAAVLGASLYRPGDRLALGLSEFNAVPLGLGGAYRRGRTEWVAEFSADLLLGSDAPELSQSPWRIAGGARHSLTEAIALAWATEVSLSERPDAGSGDRFLPVEPRFQVLVGFAYTLARWEPRDPTPAPLAPRLEPAPPPAAAPAKSLLINVTTMDGYPLSDAVVELEVGKLRVAVPHRDLQSFFSSEPPSGDGTLRISAPRLKPQTRKVLLESGADVVVDVQLEAEPPRSQLQGLVRKLDGRGLRARIRIEPLDMELFTDDAGSFVVDVPPGRYVITFDAPGCESQRRQVEVAPDGVVILNADLPNASQ